MHTLWASTKSNVLPFLQPPHSGGNHFTNNFLLSHRQTGGYEWISFHFPQSCNGLIKITFRLFSNHPTHTGGGIYFTSDESKLITLLAKKRESLRHKLHCSGLVARLPQSTHARILARASHDGGILTCCSGHPAGHPLKGASWHVLRASHLGASRRASWRSAQGIPYRGISRPAYRRDPFHSQRSIIQNKDIEFFLHYLIVNESKTCPT